MTCSKITSVVRAALAGGMLAGAATIFGHDISALVRDRPVGCMVIAGMFGLAALAIVSFGQILGIAAQEGTLHLTLGPIHIGHEERPEPKRLEPRTKKKRRKNRARDRPPSGRPT